MRYYYLDFGRESCGDCDRRGVLTVWDLDRTQVRWPSTGRGRHWSDSRKKNERTLN